MSDENFFIKIQNMILLEKGFFLKSISLRKSHFGSKTAKQTSISYNSFMNSVNVCGTYSHPKTFKPVGINNILTELKI